MSDKGDEVLDAAEAGQGCAPADAKCVMVEGKCIPLDKIKAEEAEEPEASLARQVFAEALGTMFLVAVIVGSGYHGDILSPDDGVALLGNTLATWGILYVLISVLGGISGAHFNPVVSCCFWLKRELSSLKFALFVPFQIGGAILGSHVAHAMFQKKIYYFDGKDRDSWGEFFSEALTTLGLLLTIFGGIKAKGDVPMLVGLFITAGYWFSSSTSFANPAVTIGRSFTDTFASITPKSWPAFMGGQAVGLVVGLPMCEWLVWGKPVKDALLVLVRSQPTKGD
ncbi:unnamed protein product [Pelagomonas calceolata]|jgi:glycerol uptake facilitator-like aquaporin|uniref:Aquaporin n=1 Tax=Pelagomonas calceolata TaxID=35677 RepID=A0A7S4E4T3_9STRA|nr:unnamed protein product [Pelagomonas calceolata]|mmetsp:Transcript_22249/g.62612  ORF Transcript_22249/g.62612 Transcript_22249/m.62612 type:complete len:282 (+) Transcript_22249:161-1006(+)